MEDIHLQNGQVEVRFAGDSGRILALEDRRRGIQLVGERALAENFRLLLPLPGLRAHYLRGDAQRLASATVTRSQAELVWRPLVSPQGTWDIEYRLQIAVEDEAVVFRSTVHNHSPFVIEEVFTPALGGLANPRERHDWQMIHSTWAGTGRQWPFYHRCQNIYLGPAEPADYIAYPGAAMPWLDLYHPGSRKGVYFSPEDPLPRFGAWMMQLRPGADWRGAWVWPDAERLGEPVGLTLAWVNFAHVQPGQTFHSPPVAVRFHDGGWHEAARLYRRWFDQHFTIDRRGQWLDREDAWQSTIISYPDDTIGYRFADLPRLAADALSAGIRVLQVDGWDIGGIDRGYPDYRPDPRLGTPQELRDALAACRALGVRTLLFSNLQAVHIDTDWYRTALHAYTARDPRGDAGDTMGWEYNTVAGQVAGTPTRMRTCNPAHEPFGRLMLEAFRGVAALGADGTQVDKVGCGVHVHSGKPDYHPEVLRHVPPDLSGTQPILDHFAAHRDACRALNPEYGLASETHWDRLVPLVNASYARHWAEDAPQLMAVTFPEFRQTCCVTGPTDFALVANCLRHGHIVNLEARCLHGTAADVPRLREFLAAALRLRRAHFDLLWDSALADPHDLVTVTCQPELKSALHLSRVRPGGLAMVLNHFGERAQQAKVDFHDRRAATVYSVRGEATRLALPASVTVPPDDVVVIVPD